MKFSTLFSSRRFPTLFLALSSALAAACREDPPAPDAGAPATDAPSEASAPSPSEPATDQPTDEPAAAVDPTEGLDPEDPPVPHPGPWLWVTRSSAGVYFDPKPSRDLKLGYVQRGGKVPVLPDKIQGEGCSKGWYQVLGGGYICSLVGTTDANDPAAKFPPRQPNVEDILPYPYMRNAHNGTPLYRSLPSKEQMYQYEPYLPAAKKAREAQGEKAPKFPPEGFGGAGPVEAKAPPPWWESGDNLHEVTLDSLHSDADGILAKRMVKGFYVAVDKTFNWNGRSWYKTTKGLVAPSDRFWQAPAFDFQGVELDGEKWKLPVAWVYGLNKTSTTYELDEEKKKLTPKGSVKKFGAVQLTGRAETIGGKEYLEIEGGTWIRASTLRQTTPGQRPEGVGPEERWIDVDVSQQTIVLFEGDKPLYATLVSTGKESKVKAKDHSTPRGMWRVREKHVVATMDGDGTAAGDLPYSIEDVPYIMYFHKAYATHGAFWHQNFGSQMSHGCVNLAPLDAKWIFYHAEPRLPDGLHGVWSSDKHPGSMVVVHD